MKHIMIGLVSGLVGLLTIAIICVLFAIAMKGCECTKACKKVDKYFIDVTTSGKCGCVDIEIIEP